jgi:Big-like domain-containing protein
VSLATLLAASSDADGDTLGITVSSTSASNATITVSQGWVFYTPAPGFTNVDSFTYTVTDPRGGSAIGTVTVAIKVDDSVGVNLAITDLHNGSFRVNGSGIPGRTYRIQYTDSLVPANWQSLGGSSVTADNAGAFQFIDATGSSTRFYRTVWP